MPSASWWPGKIPIRSPTIRKQLFLHMARVEHEREDLLREATALRERAALVVPGFVEPVTCGFHKPTNAGDIDSLGGLSIYFGQDPVYHFDEAGRLRRAFSADCLYRSQGTTLARLIRVRTEQETILSRHDLSPADCDEFLDRMTDRLRLLFNSLAENKAVVQAQLPVDFDLRPKLQERLQQLLSAPARLAPRLKR